MTNDNIFCCGDCNCCADWDYVKCFNDKKNQSMLFYYCTNGLREMVMAKHPWNKTYRVVEDKWFGEGHGLSLH